MLTLRFYLDDMVKDQRNRNIPAIIKAGVSFLSLSCVSNPPTDWCLLAVVAEDHAPIEVLATIDALPDVSLDSTDTALRYAVAALLSNRGATSDKLTWLDTTAAYRDIINGIPVNLLDWQSFDADSYLPPAE